MSKKCVKVWLEICIYKMPSVRSAVSGETPFLENGGDKPT
jgi:hypothetical protein